MATSLEESCTIDELLEEFGEEIARRFGLVVELLFAGQITSIQEPVPIVDGKELALATLEARITSLEPQQLRKDEQLGVAANQIGELHRLLAQNVLNVAPARPWWKILVRQEHTVEPYSLAT